jgi:hypothetical protein
MEPEPIKIYIAGPLFGSGHPAENVYKAVSAAEFLELKLRPITSQRKLITLVPHLSILWEMIAPRDDAQHWLAKDKVILENCNVLYRLAGHSPGADQEEAWATELGIPIYREAEDGINTLMNDLGIGVKP